MPIVNQARRSYPARAFDRCDACSSVALDAIVQSVLYVLAHAAPSVLGGADEPIEMRYRLGATLWDEAGEEIAADELEAEQSIAFGDAEEVDPGAPAETAAPTAEAEAPTAEAEASEAASEASGSPRPDAQTAHEAHAQLEDFQALVQRVELRADESGSRGVTGIVAGSLFGFERLVGPFEVEVRPGS